VTGLPPPAPAERLIPVFRRTRTVLARDLDVLDHVNNVVWLRFVVELAEAHSTALGLDFASLRRLGGVWVVRRHELDYHRSANEGDEIVEETWVSVLRGARSVRHARLRCARSGALLLEATTHWAFVDAGSGRPRRVPAELARRYPLVAAPPP
jgi:acyl-CoA thioester hydrolase